MSAGRKREQNEINYCDWSEQNERIERKRERREMGIKLRNQKEAKSDKTCATSRIYSVE